MSFHRQGLIEGGAVPERAAIRDVKSGAEISSFPEHLLIHLLGE